MTFRFVCPHCQHATVVEDRYAGQSGECAVCGKAITVVPDAKEITDARGAKSTDGSGGGVAMVLLALGGISAIGVFIVAVMFMAVPATQMANNNAGQIACAANLTRIGEAMLDYHAQYGRFPPAFVADKNGKPMHSWRMLLLPHLGEYSLYRNYNQKAPWDSPENMYAVGAPPSLYNCPDDLSTSPADTSYLVVTGPGTVFDGTTSASLDDITDGPANTILVVEVASSSQHWLEPRELDRQTLSMKLNTGAAREIGSFHPTGGAHVLMADGSVRFISNLTPPQVLEAMLTIDAGDDVGQ